ncbi:MAG: DUF2304 family protein [Candidatus Magasanikbacteria bacterium]|nr:DUF2304 family protein [Candidatus Magasanikbacteria bacterium]
MLIQILLSLFIFFALIKVIGRWRAKEVSLGALIFWCVFWLIVLVVVWQPRLSTELANRLGVGRGTDLIMYVSVAALFYFIFRLTVRIEKMEKNITKIVKEIAKK